MFLNKITKIIVENSHYLLKIKRKTTKYFRKWLEKFGFERKRKLIEKVG
jgi:hypothetical protein